MAGLETLHIEKVEVGYELDSKKGDTCTTILRTPSKAPHTSPPQRYPQIEELVGCPDFPTPVEKNARF